MLSNGITLGARRGVALGGGEETPWTPAQLEAILLGWWDFGDASVLFEDTSGTDAAEPDDFIARVNDKSSAGRNATQVGATTLRPIYKTVVQNGRSVGRFDGGDFLTWSNTGLGIGDLCAAVVMKFSTTAGEQQAFVPSDNGDGAFRFYVPRLLSDRFYFGYGDSASKINAAAADTNWHLFLLNATASGVAARIDGAEVGTTARATGITTSRPGYIGAINGALNASGDIAEIVLTSGLSADNVTLLETYLRARWGV